MPSGYARTPQSTSCAICGGPFVMASTNHKYCSVRCKRVGARATGCESTDRQYALISGDWARYYNRLRCQKGRQALTLTGLLDLHTRQGGRCALSGELMTCVLEKGTRCATNASLDRIDPKGPYVIENIQLVCAALNKFRIDTPVDEFILWCKKVANHALRE